jgi:hypothetical protein
VFVEVQEQPDQLNRGDTRHTMGQPIVHFEIIGKDAKKLRSYYGDLFGWEFDTSAPVAEAIADRDRSLEGDSWKKSFVRRENL